MYHMKLELLFGICGGAQTDSDGISVHNKFRSDLFKPHPLHTAIKVDSYPDLFFASLCQKETPCTYLKIKLIHS